MILTNTETIPGKEIKEILGVVRGNTVRARNVGRDITAMLKNIFGGEIKEYSKLLTQSRDEAVKRMITEAEKLNADAILGIRFSTSNIMQGTSEIMVYGTAVKF